MRVWVIGNAAVDELMKVDAWPAPGTSVLGESKGRDLGGKGANQATMIARCGIDVELVTAVGRDAAGEWIMTALADEKVSTRHGRRCDHATDRSVILLGPAGENAIVTTVDCAAEIGSTEIAAAIAGTAPEDTLVVQGNLPVAATRDALEQARTRRVRTAFNPSPIRKRFSALLPLVDLLVVNVHEAAMLSDAHDAETAAAYLRDAGAENVVITLGAEGVLADTPSGLLKVPARQAQVVDTTGAGDTFAGVLIARWCLQGTVAAADIDAAIAAAAITVGRRGTRSAFPTRDELAALFAAVA